MYAYIKGIVTEIGVSYIVVEANGVGYFIFVATPGKYHLKETHMVYVYQYVREDEESLYGFSTKEEKEFFLRLINVKGVGCKMALGLFTESLSRTMDAIEQGDIAYLKKFPKVGEKVARQIILDLKGKLVESPASGKNIDSGELGEALKSLGYKPLQINKILPKIDQSKSIEDQIRQALKLL